jgi:hypothetical protein
MVAQWDTMELDLPWKPKEQFISGFGGAYTGRYAISGDVGITNNIRDVDCFDPAYAATDADNIARAKFYKELNKLRESFSGLTFLGELRETLHMLRRPAAALWDKNKGYLSALSKAKRRDPRNWLKTAGGLWLEQAFGWAPLLNDCKDAYQAYENLVKPNSQSSVMVKAKGKKEFDRSGLMPSYLSTGYIGWYNDARWVQNTQMRLLERHSVRYIGSVRSLTRATQWDNLKLFGFSAEDFIPTAWELLPWSFLVDYFTNVGDILQAAVTQTNNVAFVNRTEIRETYFSGSVSTVPGMLPSGASPSDWVIVSEDNSTYNWSNRRRVVSRSPQAGVPIPDFSLSVDLTDKQLGNIAALLTGASALHPQRRFRF